LGVQSDIAWGDPSAGLVLLIRSSKVLNISAAYVTNDGAHQRAPNLSCGLSVRDVAPDRTSQAVYCAIIALTVAWSFLSHRLALSFFPVELTLSVV